MGSADAMPGELQERQQEERREVRVHCRLTVQFSLSGMLNYGVCWNLGLHGMYVAYEGDVIQGEPIELSFVLSDQYPSLVESLGRVAWTNSGGSHLNDQLPEGFGVEFSNLSVESRSIISRFIDCC